MLSLLGLFNAEVFAMDPLLYMYLPEIGEPHHRTECAYTQPTPSPLLVFQKSTYNPPQSPFRQGLALAEFINLLQRNCEADVALESGKNRNAISGERKRKKIAGTIVPELEHALRIQ